LALLKKKGEIMIYSKNGQALIQLALAKGLTTASELAQFIKLIDESVA
jgi:hypothetical protein